MIFRDHDPVRVRADNASVLVHGRHKVSGGFLVLDHELILCCRRREVTEIVLLREYRTRLVAEVVGGKLDVREAAASVRV